MSARYTEPPHDRLQQASNTGYALKSPNLAPAAVGSDSENLSDMLESTTNILAECHQVVECVLGSLGVCPQPECPAENSGLSGIPRTAQSNRGITLDLLGKLHRVSRVLSG